jgi:arylsulfatase A-like enzyme
VDTVAERMKRAGYATAAVTSFTWLSPERGFAQGFDRFDTAYEKDHPERGVTGPAAVESALAAWKDLAAAAAPIFLWVHLFDAHERYIEHKGLSFGGGRGGAYDAEIAFVDQRLGELVDAIGGSGRKVAWIVHGSNGEGLGEHDFTGHGSELYEEAIRVPLVVVAPGVAPERRASYAASVIDVPATVLALGGAPAEGASGQSLLDEGNKRPVYLRAHRRAALVDWPLKLMKIERKKKDRLFLFDLSADPGETKDLSQDRPADVERLDKALAALEAR